LIFTVTNGITNGVYTTLTSADLAVPWTSWLPVASNIPTSGNFTFTATNAVDASARQRFYILRGD